MAEEPNSTEAARILAAKKRRKQGTCAVCGKPFTGLARRIYCGHACAERASYRRRKTRQVPESKWVQAAREFAARERAGEVTVPPLVARLDALAQELARGRTFPDSTPKVRAGRKRSRDNTPPNTLALIESTRDAPVSPLLARLDATAAALARGRTFPDSTPIIRADRERWPDDA